MALGSIPSRHLVSLTSSNIVFYDLLKGLKSQMRGPGSILERAQRIDSGTWDRPANIPIRRTFAREKVPCQRTLPVYRSAAATVARTGTSGFTVQCSLQYATRPSHFTCYLLSLF